MPTSPTSIEGGPCRELANQGIWASPKVFGNSDMERISLVGQLILSWPAGKTRGKLQNSSCVAERAMRIAWRRIGPALYYLKHALRHSRRLHAEFRHGGAFPKSRLAQRAHHEKVRNGLAVGGGGFSRPRRLDSQREFIGTEPAIHRQRTDRGIGLGAVRRRRTRAIDDPVCAECDKLSLAAPSELEPHRVTFRHSRLDTSRYDAHQAAIQQGLGPLSHGRCHAMPVHFPIRTE